MNMILLAVLVFYQFPAALSNVDANKNLYYYQQTFNLIENIINWRNFNVKFWWMLVSDATPSDSGLKSVFLNTPTPKIVSTPQAVNFTDARDFAAIFFVDHNRIEEQLNMSLKLPPDVIKIYLNHNGCQLNEAKLTEIMNTLWRSSEIGFIYYISFCSLSRADNYDPVDSGHLGHEDNYNCAINLFYHQPFVVDKSGQWGVMEKVDLINDRGGVRRQRINTSSRVFHHFPFQRKHNLKLNRLNMTVIFFPSTNAYHKSELDIFRKLLSKKVLNDPWHHFEAYFGVDAELLNELQAQMDFSLTLSPTSDRQLYGFKVSPDTS